MRKKLSVLVAAGLLLTGCAATESADPSPTPSADPNAAACANFESTFASGISPEPEYLTDWEETRDAIDVIGLASQGDVKERIQALVSGWPDLGDLFIWNDLDDTNRMLGDIERACSAAGEDISVQLATVD